MRPVLVAVLAVLLATPGGAVADPAGSGPTAGAGWLLPPVDAPIARRFQAPGTDWGPGHRGVDFRIGEGTAVRAAAAGEVTFAGSVAGTLAVTIAHDDNLETTYSDLAEVAVTAGERVAAGTWIGRAGHAHAGEAEGGLHFGVKHLGSYVDPESYLGPVDISGAISLAPLHHVHSFDRRAERWMPRSVEDGREDCTVPAPLAAGAPAQNDNVAVVIAGIGTRTAGGESPGIVDAARRLGYDDAEVFSYRGLDSVGRHLPYDKADTWDSLQKQAFRLASLLRAIGRRYPGRGVDLLAHSQGGLIARAYLAYLVEGWDPGLPQVDHLVTYSTPHRGTRLADVPFDIRTGTPTGGLAARAAGTIAGFDPYAAAVAEMRPRSAFLRSLAAEDVALGTRVLALTTPDDVVVPATRASFEGETPVAVRSQGGLGHEAILRSPAADAAAYAFLRDADPACRTWVDGFAGDMGRLIDLGHRILPDAYAALEDRVLTGAGKALRGVWRRTGTKRAPSVGGMGGYGGGS